MVNTMSTAALKRRMHPNSLKALAQNRSRTQFGGPDAPATCARPSCGRVAWSKSPSGLCWTHSSPSLKKEPRPTEYGQHKRSLNRARAVAKAHLVSNPPTMEERAHTASLAPRLRDPYDFDRLQVLVCQVIRGEITHRAYHSLLGDLLD